jgi:citrate lyase subunit beta / citryl-CoA lyase
VTLENLADRLMDLGTDHGITVWAMIETPVAVLNVREIAAAARDTETRLSCLVIGTNDLAKEMRAQIVPGRAPVLPLLVTTIATARAYGLDILDGPFNDLANAQGFAEECAQARDLGFDGKTLIHPNQIAPCNAAFTPSADEIARARQVIAAFDQPENQSKGVIALEGRMVERLHAEIARRTVAIADAIEERGA